MEHTPPGRMQSVDELRARLRAIDPELDCDTELEGADGPLGKPLELRFKSQRGGRTLANRFCVHPMEGWDGEHDGTPSELTLRRWLRFGRSMSKLIWGGEAFAVSEDGRANDRQLFLNPAADTKGGLARLLAALHEGHEEIGEDPDELYVGLQLTHSGRWAHPHGSNAEPRIAYRHPVLDARFGLASDHPVLTDGELEAIGACYVRAAELARDVGFDFIDVKSCHGYLMHELLGARAREGRYGGSFENRTRFFREVVAGIRTACPELEIGVRVSVADVFPFTKDPETGVGAPRGWEEHVPYEHGFGIDRDDPRCFDLEEPLRFLGLLQELGIGLVNVSIGCPYTSPHVQRPATYPPSDGYLPPEDPLVGVAQHLRVTRACKEAFPDLVVVGSGYSYLQEYLPHVAQHEVRAGHVDLVGLGRMVLTYPELPYDVLRGNGLQRKRICRTFSDCTTGPRHNIVSGCYPLDPFYQRRPEAERIRAVKKEAGT
ncbi:MAG: NADH:flavin oxidoreductase [Planctomycetota bacterium]|nr:NADH:flavin oxidoreductase [Planctomycetota bacterium]